jgi:predicted SAM-dependent methyltransferase
MRTAIKRVMAKALPGYIVNQVTTEIRISARRMLTAGLVRRNLAAQKGCRVNIGCGKNPVQGWINLDVVSYPGVYFWDCRSGLPFSDASVATIYSEHFFEHLDAETEACVFLRECLRCLQSEGVLRLVVPDAGAYLRAYSGPWEPLAEMRPLDRIVDGWRDQRLGWIYQTKMQFMNAIFRQRFEHKYAYDDETLVLVLRKAGFAHAVVQQFGISIDPNMAPDSEDRRTESLYVEAVKK